jgi:hypothetical protein
MTACKNALDTFSSILGKKSAACLMHLIMRSAWVLAAGAVLSVRAGAETQTEYRQSDTSYYLRGEVFSADPGAPVVTPEAATNMGGTYLITTRGQAPRFVYLPENHDWIEPITPPSEPASLNIAPTAMQVREPQGNVQVALPSSPASFRDVEKGMTLPNGSTLRTGDSGSVAVLFGGVDSVRLAPDTLATVQMTVAGGLREVEVDVRDGMVFSKVGARAGEKQHYAVHTPFGDATAHGTDYVTVVYPARVDVWVAQGTVGLKAPDGSDQTTVSTGHEALKVMRYPVPKEPKTAMAESAESLTALLNFIPMANRKLAVLDERRRSGSDLTPQEKDYVGRIRQVSALIRLANVNAPPEPAPMAPPVVATNPPPRAQLVALPPMNLPPTAKPAMKAKAVALAKPSVKKPAVLASAKIASVSKEASAVKVSANKAKPIASVSPSAQSPKKASGLADNKTTTPGKTRKLAKDKTKKSAVVATATKTKPDSGEHYLRAQPVDPADLVVSPTVETAPPPLTHPPLAPPPAAPPEQVHATAEADPNSLGAPLNPLRPMLSPSPLEPAASTAIGSSER